MKAIIPEKDAASKKEKSVSRSSASTSSVEKSSTHINVKFDDNFNSIIVKKAENKIKESPVKSKKTTTPSELWLG